MSTEAADLLAQRFGNNTYNDPENLVRGHGQLSTPQIDYYMRRYGIVDGYDRRGLKAAVYEMRVGSEAMRWDDRVALRFRLQEDAPGPELNLLQRLFAHDDAHRYLWPISVTTSTLVLPPNSLTFVSLYERFNLPRDIFGRFNLKSRFVHHGLLVGGGPIVEPGYTERLVVPLHNFSNIPVELKYGEPLINVEFTRTLNPDAADLGDVPHLENPLTHLGPQEFFSNSKYVESSVYAAIEKNASLLRSFASKMRVAGIASVIGLVALITAFYNLIVNLSNSSNQTTLKLHETQEKIADFNSRNQKRMQEIGAALDELVAEIQRLRQGAPGSLEKLERQAGALRDDVSGPRGPDAARP